jgi:hypothetical protein
MVEQDRRQKCPPVPKKVFNRLKKGKLRIIFEPSKMNS